MRIELMNCLIDNLSLEETLLAVEQYVISGIPHQLVVINVDTIVKANKDITFLEIINGCDLINADGMPVVWASRLLGKPLKERVAGVDLFNALIKRSAEMGWRVYLLGAREEVVQQVVNRFCLQYPKLQIAGWHSGYWSEDEEEVVVEAIHQSRPNLLFLGINSPKKEEFMAHYAKKLSIPFSMGVGGAFDLASGRTRRAPVWMQRCGLEWFFRFLQEPRRMFKRYFIDDLYFFVLLFREWRRKTT